MTWISKWFLLIPALFFITQVTAQRDGIRAGLVMSTMLMKDNSINYSDDFSLKPGFTAGFTGMLNINDVTGLETGLLFTSKGYRASNPSGSQYVNPIYLEIPVNLIITEPLGPKTNIYLSAGPYLGIGLMGKIRMESFDGSLSRVREYNIQWGSGQGNGDLKRLDYGVSVGTGIQYGSLHAGLYYSHGLANVASYTGNGSKIANRVFGITLTFYMNSLERQLTK